MTGIAVGMAGLLGAGFGWWATVAVAAAVSAAYLLVRDRIQFASLALILVAAALGAWRASGIDRSLPTTAPTLAGTTVTVTSEPIRTGGSQYFIVGPGTTRAAVTDASGWRVCVTAGREPTIHVGDSIQLWGNGQRSVDVSLAQRSSLLKKECGSRWYASQMEIVSAAPTSSRLLPTIKSNLNDALRAAAPGDAGVLLSGLVTGDDSGFSQAREEALYRSSTTHLTSVSGSNLALLAGMLAAIGTATMGRHRLVWQLVTIGGVWGYAFVAGVQPPSVRAAIVATAAVLAFLVGRRPDFVTLILLAAALMVVVEPAQVSWLGFQLSVAASLALALVVPAMVVNGRLGVIGVVLAATTIAQLGTLPFLLPAIGTLSLTSVFANLLVAPLVAVAMPLAATAGIVGMASPSVGEIVAAPAALLAEGTLRIIDALGGTSAAVRTGAPPRDAALAFASIAAAAVFLLSASGRRLVNDFILNVKARGPFRTPSPFPPLVGDGFATEFGRLVPATAWIVAREDPAHTLGADTDHAVHEPPGQEEAHQVTDERQSAQAISG